MRVRVTIARLVAQYADVLIADVESIDEAEAQVAAAIESPGPARQRLLKKLTWFGDTLQEPEQVHSSVEYTAEGD